ncbi:MAG: DUF2892 domain-containing protein [Chitinophagaceae bacterium]|nr:DUF2892 domain-containing protein [Chitinophagaceae bacterium]
MSNNSDHASSEKKVIWFSRILRWVLGLFFIGSGILYYSEGAWPAIVLGAVFIITGFFKPTRCLGGACAIPMQYSSQTEDQPASTLQKAEQ